jgi:hypothetical protein
VRGVGADRVHHGGAAAAVLDAGSRRPRAVAGRRHSPEFAVFATPAWSCRPWPSASWRGCYVWWCTCARPSWPSCASAFHMARLEQSARGAPRPDSTPTSSATMTSWRPGKIDPEQTDREVSRRRTTLLPFASFVAHCAAY